MKFPELFFAHQSAFLGMFLTMPFALPATRTYHALTGNIQVLEKCPNVTSINFAGGTEIEGEHTLNEQSAFWGTFLLTFDWLPSCRQVRGLQGAWCSSRAQHPWLREDRLQERSRGAADHAVGRANPEAGPLENRRRRYDWNFLLLIADSALFLEEISSMRILREFLRVTRRTCRNFLEIS